MSEIILLERCPHSAPVEKIGRYPKAQVLAVREALERSSMPEGSIVVPCRSISSALKKLAQHGRGNGCEGYHGESVSVQRHDWKPWVGFWSNQDRAVKLAYYHKIAQWLVILPEGYKP